MSSAVNYRIYEPLTEPSRLMVMGNILGGTLDEVGPLPGDHDWRASQVAKDNPDAVVLAYERIATGYHSRIGAGQLVKPDRYAASVAKTGAYLSREIEKWGDLPVVGGGASAAASELLEITNTETVQFEALRLFDPANQMDIAPVDGLKLWLKHQKSEATKTPSESNQNPIPPDQPWTTIANGLSLVRTAREMRAYAHTWNNSRSIELLKYFATASAFDDLAVHLVLPGQTFTSAPGQAAETTEELNCLVSPDRTAPFKAIYLPHLRHSWTDDPKRFSLLVTNPDALESSNYTGLC